MKILFDHQVYSFQRVGGISTYFNQIQKALKKKNIKFLNWVFISENQILDSENILLHCKPHVQFVGKKYLLDLINRLFMIPQLVLSDYDVFFPTYYKPYFLPFVKKPYVITVHDMTHEKYPELFKNNRDYTLKYKERVIKKASHVIAISESTKKDLVSFYQIPATKITTIYHGISKEFTTQNVSLQEPYFVFSGSREQYKNFPCLLEAFRKILNKHPNISLYCSGKKFNRNELSLIKSLGLENNVHASFYSENELNFLYQNSLALVYPSLYEGFGYPILEAMRAQTVVISSNSSSLPEVGGNASLYFNPNDSGELELIMNRVIQMNPEERDKIIKLGLNNIERFSIQTSMDRTIQVLKTLSSLQKQV